MRIRYEAFELDTLGSRWVQTKCSAARAQAQGRGRMRNYKEIIHLTIVNNNYYIMAKTSHFQKHYSCRSICCMLYHI
jgi:hypothetical protein